MKILSLNCQKAYNSNLLGFLTKVMESGEYDFLLLQEATEQVLSYVRPFGTYKVLTCTEGDRPGLVCVVYKSSIALESSQHVLWPQFHSAENSGRGHISFGIVSGVFTLEDKKIAQIASVHLPSGLSASRRSKCLPKIKQMLTAQTGVDATFFGGDCNFCYPGELAKAKSALLPDYECVTDALPATLNSCYTEKLSDALSYRFITVSAYILSLLNICLKFKTDHIFVNLTTANRPRKVSILLDRVSDHSPIELIVHQNIA